MALVDFTTFDDIRAVLGVSSDELSDATISLDVYDFNLTFDLERIDLSLPGDYATVAVLDTRNAAENRFYRACRLFATYVVAKQLLESLPLFAPKEQADGKAALVRFAQNPYKDTIERVEKAYQSFRDQLVMVYAAYQSVDSPVTAVLTWAAAASPISDPVTGT